MALRKRPNHLDDDPDVTRLELELVRVLQAQLADLDYNSPDCLALAIDMFDKARVERQEVARRLGVGTTTVSRWAAREIEPRAAAFRKAMLSEMRAVMADVVTDRNEKYAKLKKRPKVAGKPGRPIPAIP